MESHPKASFIPRRRTLAALYIASSLAILLTIGSGYLNFRSTTALNDSEAWVEHSQVVINETKNMSQHLIEMEASLRLFIATGNNAYLRSYTDAARSFDTSELNVLRLTADNPTHQQQISELREIFEQFESQLNSQIAEHQNNKTPVTLPETLLNHLRSGTEVMEQRERALLTQRIQATNLSSRRTLQTNIAFMLLTTIMVLLLLVLLLRDFVRRRRMEEDLMQTNRRLTETIHRMELHASETAFISTVAEELQLCIEPQEAYQCTTRAAQRLLPSTHGVLALINHSRQMAEVVSSWGGDAPFIDIFPPETCCGLRSGRMRIRQPGTSEVDCTHFLRDMPTHYLCLPLAAQGETLGVLSIECLDTSCPEDLEIHLNSLKELGELSAMAIANLNLRAKLRNQSIRDSLTGLFNRHFMEISLDREIQRAMRHKSTLAVLMMDVDHFKDFNDKYGHEAGDVVLREFALVLRQCVRSEDVVCRYGGEEFLIILPDTNAATAWERAELIRHQVEKARVQYNGESLNNITVSIGIAIYPFNGESRELLVRVADENLYHAKQKGRNQTRLTELVAVN
ncbi:MAG: sensor domain-containing diguanylate cyclase [Acidobacteriaceae bacterium]